MRSDVVRSGTDAADHAGAEHGRAFLDGDDLRIQSGAAGGGHAAAHVPDADDGGGNDYAGAGADYRRGRGGIAGDCDGAAAGSGGIGVRHAAGGRRSRCRAWAGGSWSWRLRRKTRRTRAATRRRRTKSFYQKQRELLGNVIAESDVVITTAVIPGKKSPVLVTKEMVAADGAGVGDRRPGGGARRELRADAAEMKSSWNTT